MVYHSVLSHVIRRHFCLWLLSTILCIRKGDTSVRGWWSLTTKLEEPWVFEWRLPNRVFLIGTLTYLYSKSVDYLLMFWLSGRVRPVLDSCISQRLPIRYWQYPTVISSNRENWCRGFINGDDSLYSAFSVKYDHLSLVIGQPRTLVSLFLIHSIVDKSQRQNWRRMTCDKTLWYTMVY